MNKGTIIKGAKAQGIVFILITILLGSCTKATIYHSYLNIDKEGWGKHDTLVYQLTDDSIPDTYSISLGLRTNDAYKYTDLWVVVAQDLEKKGTFVRDTVKFPITDKNGIMLGNGYAAYQQEIPVLTAKKTLAGGNTIKVFHIMKREVITGIQDVGINVSSDSLQHLSSGK